MSLKNWDNKTWLSSTSYIKSFNKFLIKETKLNKNSEILDIGCGRGKILGNLTSKLRLAYKPIGIDIEQHKDRDKRIIFNKTDAISYLKKNKKKFDLIYIDGSHHYLDVKEDLINSINVINNNGIIILDDFIWDYYEKVEENPIGGILPLIQADPNIEIMSISNQIILKVKS